MQRPVSICNLYFARGCYLNTRADTRACTAGTDASQRPHNRTGESKLVHAGQILQRHQQQNELALSWMYASSNDDYGGRPVATVGPISPDRDICIAGDGMVR